MFKYIFKDSDFNPIKIRYFNYKFEYFKEKWIEIC